MVARKHLVKVFGISRKVLDRYNELGLLCPSNIDEIETGKQVGQKPEWKYEDDAYNRLYFIEILRFIGYEPSEIKNLVDESDSILDDTMSMLLEKKKELEVMISFVKIMQITANVPEITKASLDNINLRYFLNDQKFRDRLENFKEYLSDNISGLDLDDSEEDVYIIFFNLFFSILLHQDKEPESDVVQSIIWEVYRIYMNEKYKDTKIYEFLDECLCYSEFTNQFVKEMKNDIINENMELIKSLYNEHSIDFILDALAFFKTKHDGNYLRKIK